MEVSAFSTLGGIYAVLDAGVSPDLPALLASVLRAGVRVVQYRAKGGLDPALTAYLGAATHDAGGLFVINDDVEAVLRTPHAGLHVGQEDLARYGDAFVAEAMRGRVLGISCGTAPEALVAERIGATYVGIGPYAVTTTKAEAGAAIGALGVRSVARAIAIPAVAIGGIGRADLAAIRSAGAAMAAVVSAIAGDDDPERAARALCRAWDEAAP